MMTLHLLQTARARRWANALANSGLAGTIGVLAVYVLVAWLEEGAVA